MQYNHFVDIDYLFTFIHLSLKASIILNEYYMYAYKCNLIMLSICYRSCWKVITINLSFNYRK